MLRRLDLRGPLGDLAVVLPRPSTADDGPLDAVRTIVADVRDRGDMALRELTARYDGVDLESVVVDPAE
ncbi:MAG: histidinol dehydrogenase, partial [Acidimicrobiaceae bacterium]|nr:histidinol dehydrogenase [Acidimicrobiaceae bacterium]